jgi:hypothetical protein
MEPTGSNTDHSSGFLASPDPDGENTCPTTKATPAPHGVREARNQKLSATALDSARSGSAMVFAHRIVHPSTHYADGWARLHEETLRH